MCLFIINSAVMTASISSLSSGSSIAASSPIPTAITANVLLIRLLSLLPCDTLLKPTTVLGGGEDNNLNSCIDSKTSGACGCVTLTGNTMGSIYTSSALNPASSAAETILTASSERTYLSRGTPWTLSMVSPI